MQVCKLVRRNKRLDIKYNDTPLQLLISCEGMHDTHEHEMKILFGLERRVVLQVQAVFPCLQSHSSWIICCSCTQQLVPLAEQHSMAVVFRSLHFKLDDATLASGWAGPTFQLDNISLFLKQAGSIVCLPLSLLITLAYLVSHHQQDSLHKHVLWLWTTEPYYTSCQKVTTVPLVDVPV
jgi:hypothetical protein